MKSRFPRMIPPFASREVPLAVLCLTILALVCASRASATSVIPPSWQSIVAEAGFVGIVECEVAGGIVARYRVVDSWKGPQNGSHLLIGQRVSVFEPQYPLALVGERYFLAADSARGAWSLPPTPSLSPFNGVPLWWRRIESQFHTSWMPTRIPTSHTEWAGGIIDWDYRGRGIPFESFREDVRRLVSLDERALELEAIRAETR